MMKIWAYRRRFLSVANTTKIFFKFAEVLFKMSLQQGSISLKIPLYDKIIAFFKKECILPRKPHLALQIDYFYRYSEDAYSLLMS